MDRAPRAPHHVTRSVQRASCRLQDVFSAPQIVFWQMVDAEWHTHRVLYVPRVCIVVGTRKSDAARIAIEQNFLSPFRFGCIRMFWGPHPRKKMTMSRSK